ncbi:response regulator transcription factor [Streptomyces sp. NPDC004134]|uniref:helix-turn-helix transcriptional regulator n=1 Tax=Streptomyces sp. NPDC004134 TaxID=3364691 RepID=UPI003696CCF7
MHVGRERTVYRPCDDRAPRQQPTPARPAAPALWASALALESAGDCPAAARTARHAAAELRATAGHHDAPGALICDGFAELADGTVERALQALEAGITWAERESTPFWLATALALSGRAELIRSRLPRAATRLWHAHALAARLDSDDPYLPPRTVLAADLAEALARTGSARRAAEVLAEARRNTARGTDQPALDRAAATVRTTQGSPRAAAGELRRSLATGRQSPLERGRGHAALGWMERRARRKAAARNAFEEALVHFTAAGCRPWLLRTRVDLADLDGSTRPLSAVERAVLARVTEGASNREIARTVHLSVKAVEANLTRLYRRYAVTSRLELAQVLRNPRADAATET